jgi:two-component system nitrogen regulation sensor histidine kinase GlnL
MSPPNPLPDALLDQLATPIAVLDAGLRVIGINQALSELLGAVRVLRQPLTQQPFGGSRIAAEAAQVLRNGSPRRLREQVLLLPGHHDGRYDVLLSPLTGGAGGGALLLELHELLADADAQALRHQQLLRALAHEMRNPLGGLRGAAQLIERHLSDPELKELAGIVLTETDRLARLTSRLLAPAAPRLGAVNVHEICERVRVLVDAEFGGTGVLFERDYDPSLPEIRGDTDRLVQALLNLARNAAQAGARRVRLKTRAERQVLIGHRSVRLAVRISVLDDGPGIPEALRGSLFLPLVSGSGGSGLGLPTALAIAHEHGGTLLVQSEPGHTQLSMLLPVTGPG